MNRSGSRHQYNDPQFYDDDEYDAREEDAADARREDALIERHEERQERKLKRDNERY